MLPFVLIGLVAGLAVVAFVIYWFVARPLERAWHEEFP
jgi:hypothetical protein